MDNSPKTINSSCEIDDGSVQDPERIGERQAEIRKTDNALYAIADALINQPPIQLPTITLSPPPPLPPMPTSPPSRGRGSDPIKAVIVSVEEEFREYPQYIAARLMLKMHELFLLPQRRMEGEW
ncbi:hypothetical protein QAD02_012921 [Eretmocerus hayati]|uniref:Uncharacterized protein n=1 Tax=Eretmocerus hayati TaxID=131215 RepID=A0ACC2P3M2_9HYME|nr:hypothetical protein QAD02_012921 [Eretmocerus hayati]